MTRRTSDITATATRWLTAVSAPLRLTMTSLVALCCLSLPVAPAAATLYTKAITIENTATASYAVGTVLRTSNSNSVSTQVCTQATLEFRKFAPGLANAGTQNLPETRYCPTGAVCDANLPETYSKVSLTASGAADPRRQSLNLITADSSHPYHVGEVIYLLIADGDRNVDTTRTEQVEITISYGSEKERLLLTETDPDTGVFAGYIQSARPVTVPMVVGDGIFTIIKSKDQGNIPIIASYEDVCETVDSVTHTEIEANALIDPYGIFFDSSSGLPIDGATITLIDLRTGNPAQVFGDDGVSTFPASVVSGGSVTDSSGEVYVFPAGFYRFPFIAPGTYRFEVTPPGGYNAPSAVTTDILQTLPGAPFAIEPGSRGEDFIVSPGPALHIDIPLDPKVSSLWVTKTAARSSAAIGDFLRYTITVENTVVNDTNAVVISDRLPLGFRYQNGSAWLDGVSGPDPTISADGRSLTFPVGTLAGGAVAEIRFVVAIGAGARSGKATNIAAANGDGGISSNTARADVLVTDDLFRAANFIVGRVFPNGCSEEQNIPGVEGVRILLEDGTYAVTDKNGKYHFAAVRPGTHAVQLDLTSIPDEYELVACDDNSRYAGNPFSQFVDAQGGSLWRADFYLARKMMRIRGDVGFELNSIFNSDSVVSETNEAADVVLYPHFASGSAELTSEDQAQLDRIAASLQGVAITGLKVHGHTDSQRISARLRKVYPDNYVLSRARAATVADYLASALNVDAALVSSEGYGPDEAIADNLTPGGRARNRRVELFVSANRTTHESIKTTGEVRYEVPVSVGDSPLTNVRLSIILPDEISYIAGTSRLGDEALPDPAINASVLTWNLGSLAAGWQGKVYFIGRLPFKGSAREFKTQALITFDNLIAEKQRTPVVDNILRRRNEVNQVKVPPMVLHPHYDSGSAVLTDTDKQLLDDVVGKLKGQTIETLRVTGHTDPQRISHRLRATYPDNYALAVARAESVAQYLAAALSLSPQQLIINGRGPDEPVASNRTPEGMAQNRRVELHINALHEKSSYELDSIKDRSGIESVTFDEIVEWTKELQLGTALKTGEIKSDKGQASESKVSTKTPLFDSAWLNKQEPGLAFVWPRHDYNPPLPFVGVVVKHNPMLKLTLRLNAQEVDGFFFDGTKKRGDLLVAASEWFGVGLKEGDNLFEAIEYDHKGEEKTRVSLTLHYASPPTQVEILKEQNGAVADGKNPVVIAVRLTDKDGHPARPGIVGEFRVAPPYVAYEKIRDLQTQPLSTSNNSWSKYHVGEDGVALIELQPTTQTGEAVVHFNLGSGEQEVRSWLKPGIRDWVLVALAEGTVGYNTATGNMESLGAMNENSDYYDDGRVAFYAKGQVKGEWLLTMAYDSGKTPADGRPGMYQTIDPNQYYLLYGDVSEQRHDAASAKKVYIKIERSQFYALFGDYATGMTVTELARYSRNLTGFKSEMKGKNFSYNVFAADSNQAYVKDELPGDGTSGLYRLSRKNIVLNSENVSIVTRDRFRSEVVVDQKELVRYLDYSIDYEDGTIFFKSPVFSRDEAFNPIQIVVEYESFDSSDSAWTYGGRGALKILDGRVEAAATYVHEAVTGGSAQLLGADLNVKISNETKVRAEIASTDSDLPTITTSTSITAVIPNKGRAWLAEVVHQSEKVESTVYIREQGEGFGLKQQAGSETGTRKIGGDLSYRLSEPLSASLGVHRQTNLATDAVRDMGELRSDYNAERYTLTGGMRHAEDNLATGENNRSEQLFLGATYSFSSRLTGSLQHDQSVYSNDNIDYPTRTTLGLDYKLSEDTSILAAQEWTTGASMSTTTTRIGMRSAPWEGGQVSSTIEQQSTEEGSRLFATNGLQQTWQLTKKWSLDAGLDRSETLRSTSKKYDINSNVPPASGSDNGFTALFVGAGYDEELWSWSGRAEHRHAHTEDKYSLFSGINGDVRDGLAMAASLQAFLTQSLFGTDSKTFDLRLSLAYRPRSPRTIILDRLEFIYDEVKNGNSSTESRRIINNFVANIKPVKRTELSLQYGAKYVLESIDSADYSGYTDLTGLECRYDITSRWDIGVRGSILHSWNLEQMQYGSSVSVGYSPAKNLWANLGYNLTGFQDRDFSRADFTAQGPFIKLRMKFDQSSVRDALKSF